MLKLTLHTRLLLNVIGIGLLLFVVASCNNDDDDDNTSPASDPGLIDFGATYIIDPTAELSNGVTLPVLVGDTLIAGIAHSGCSDEHEYELRTRVLNSTRAEVWLYKVTADEPCAAAFSYHRNFRVPFEVLAREEIVLVAPNYFNFELR